MQRPQGGAAEDFVATEAEVEWTVGPTGQGEVQEAEGTQLGLLHHSVKAVFHSRLPDSHKGQCYASLLDQHLTYFWLLIVLHRLAWAWFLCTPPLLKAFIM